MRTFALRTPVLAKVQRGEELVPLAGIIIGVTYNKEPTYDVLVGKQVYNNLPPDVLSVV